jgi:hypothetical protein
MLLPVNRWQNRDKTERTAETVSKPEHHTINELRQGIAATNGEKISIGEPLLARLDQVPATRRRRHMSVARADPDPHGESRRTRHNQGSELWEFSMIDPDNRRAVDFLRRQALWRTWQTAMVQPC